MVERLEAEALDPKLDQQERLRALIIPAGKQRDTLKGPPVSRAHSIKETWPIIYASADLPPRDLPLTNHPTGGRLGPAEAWQLALR